MAEVGINELLEAGVHFGHQTRRWNPKMRRFIHGERGGIYIIDLLKTERLLREAQEFASAVAHRGGTVLFVGTKKQARDAVKDVAEASGMPYVNHRWLGGLLTNFQTITQRIKRLHDLERYETEGQLALLPTRERMAAAGRPREAAREPRRRQEHDAPAERDVRHRPQDRGDRRPRGPAPAHPDHRPRRHELRPGRHRLRHPGQRRRDPLVRAHHAARSATSSARAHAVFREREEERAQGGRGGSARREAEERAAPRGRGAGARARRPAEREAAEAAAQAAEAEAARPRRGRRGRGRRAPPRRRRPPGRRGRGRRGRADADAGARPRRRRRPPTPRRPAPPTTPTGARPTPAPPAEDPTPPRRPPSRRRRRAAPRRRAEPRRSRRRPPPKPRRAPRPAEPAPPRPSPRAEAAPAPEPRRSTK